MQTTLQVGESVVTLQYNLGTELVVFSHGFGVRHDSRGMFTDIVAGLPRSWGYILFDYDSFDETTNQVRVVGFAERLRRLQAVLDWAHQQAGVAQIHVIGHSLGAVTVAALAPENIGKMLLLAPPLTLGIRFAELFTKRPGATHDDSQWTLPRTDGSVTTVNDATLAEIISVDAEGELSKLAMFRAFTIVLPSQDEKLPEADYTGLITMPAVTMISIDKANHDFQGDGRQKLVTAMFDQLTDGMS